MILSSFLATSQKPPKYLGFVPKYTQFSLAPTIVRVMYYDDPYDPNIPNDYDEDDVPPRHNVWDVENDYEESSVATSVSTGRKTRRRLIDESKKADSGYFSVKRTIDGRRIKVEYYHTRSTPGSTIRNAVTGLYEVKQRVGSADQDLYFKVVMATGEGGKDPHHLFYDSPEQFEKHFYTTLSSEIKSKWSDRALNARILRIQLENDKKPEFIEVR